MFDRTRSQVRQLLANERGAAIIELALVAPILALTVIGIVDMSNAYSRKLALEQGAQRAIEKIMQTTQGDTVDDTIKNEAVCQVNGTTSTSTTVNGTTTTTTSCKTTPITAANVTVTYRLECTNADGTVETKLNAAPWRRRRCVRRSASGGFASRDATTSSSFFSRPPASER